MKAKEQVVFDSALKLFAQKGVEGSSIHSIAEAANVSPSFIYRLYKNKAGLIAAVLEEGSKRGIELVEQLRAIKDPKEALLTMLQIPFQVNEAEYDFWRLVYALKWQTKTYYLDSTNQFLAFATDTFEQLGYAYPKSEAEILVMLLEGAVTAMLLTSGFEQQALTLTCIRSKYDV
jgi:AcrR family transcriptional regulator